MIISDLNYLEVVAEASSVVGGGSSKGITVTLPVFVFIPDITTQTNVADIKQNSSATSAAVVNGYGDAYSEANSGNYLELNQANVAS